MPRFCSGGLTVTADWKRTGAKLMSHPPRIVIDPVKKRPRVAAMPSPELLNNLVSTKGGVFHVRWPSEAVGADTRPVDGFGEPSYAGDAKHKLVVHKG